MMISTIHKISAALATAMIATFWLSTVVAEAFLDNGAVVAVKTTIPYGFCVLIPALAAAGGTGFRMARAHGTGAVGAKRRRMPFIAANGVLILIPSALFLAAKAQVGEFDGSFYAVQAVELIAGAINLLLIGLNIRDGRHMTAGRSRRIASHAA